jgi:competence protein ComEC
VTVDLRLVVPAIVCWLSAGVLVAFPGAAGWAAAAFGAAALALLVWALRTRRRALRGIIAVASLAGVAGCATAGLVAVGSQSRAPAALEQWSQRTVRVVARIESLPASYNNSRAEGLRVRVTAHELQTAGQVVRGAVPVLVFLDGGGLGESGDRVLDIGATVVVTGAMRATEPGDDVTALVFARGSPTLVEPAPWWLSWANTMRDRFRAAAAALPGDGGDLLPGLAVGDEREVSETLDEAMKASSLSHLTAVSGANCAVVVGLAMVAAASAGAGRGLRVAVAMLTLLGFVVLVTPGASVLRAAVMAVVVAVSFASGRPGRGLPALALAIIALVLVDPWMSRSYGFVLSVLATAGLLVLAPILHTALARWMPSALALAIAIPAAAQLACQPALVLLNPTLPGFGVPANLLAEPAAVLATVLGLFACVLVTFAPVAGAAATHLAWFPSAWIAGVARVSADLPGNRIPWADGAAGLLLAVGLGALVVALAVPATSGRSRRVRAVVVVTGCAGALCLVLASLGTGVVRSLARPGDWQLAACDIGQGDAVLVRDGDAHALIDVGPDPAPLRACLDELGVERIDLLVLTHFDLDHVGGIDAVRGRVGTALVGAPQTPKERALIESLRTAGARVHRAFSGDEGTLGTIRWKVLWPDTRGGAMAAGNEGSVAMQFAGRGLTSLFLADLDETAQRVLLSRHDPGRVDVVKVAHHGSADQSEALYRRLAARVAIISVGAHNDYGHPTRRLLSILGRTNTRALRTDRQGTLVLTPDGDTIDVWTER